jgi:ribosomal protein L14E/L6E/L27E
MVWAPNEQTRGAVKFWLDCLQVVTVVAGVFTATLTIVKYINDQKVLAADHKQRETDRDERAKQQLAALKRELQRPYEEKKLNLYLDAARVLAHLAASPSIDKEKTEARFWELYWGELAFVESTTAEEKQGGPPSVERLMVVFCHQYFQNDPSGRCSKEDVGGPGGIMKVSTTGEKQAIDMARQASKEIRAQWELLGR